jgi:hypothetical protein
VEDVTTRFVADLIGRLSGPLSFRLILQPMMAAFFALRDGLKEERKDLPPYFWGLFSASPALRRELIRNGWKAVVKVFSLAVVLDVVYQVIVFRWVYPFEALAVAIILAIVPYVLLRGLVNRLVRSWTHNKAHASR